MPARGLLTLADNLFNLLADALQRDPETLQCLGRNALALMDEAEQDVLGADVVVVEHPSLFLRQDDNPTCPVGEPLEHPCSLRAVSVAAVAPTAADPEGSSLR